MAVGARSACRSDWGLATTGVAGPDPQDGVPVGTVFLAVTGPPVTRPGQTAPGGPDARVVRLALSGDRSTIRRTAVAEALALLADALEPRRRES
jgi:nicotinamide-nucleotide amidase